MSDVTSPTLRRIQLGFELRRIRESLGKTIEQVSRDLSELHGPGFSTTKISRMETGKRPAAQRDVRDVCEYYGTSPEERDRLIAMAKESREGDPWQGLSESLATYFALESIAREVWSYESMLIPGLLQIPEYSRALAVGNDLDRTGRPDGGDPELEPKIMLRQARRVRLIEPEPLRLVAVIDEAVVRRRINPPEVMIRQIQDLLEISAERNVDLRLVPFDNGAYPGLETSGFSMLHFEPNTYKQDYVCFVETQIGAAWVDRDADRQHMWRSFERIREISLDVAETREVLESVLDELMQARPARSVVKP